MIRAFLLAFLLTASSVAQPFHVYVGRVAADSALIAWGATRGNGNTIGLDSASLGPATLRIAGRILAENRRNYIEVRGLEPDRSYPYEVLLNGRRIGGGAVRTWPKTAGKLAFFVIGDYGTGGQPQYEVAAAMARVFRERQAGDNPVRFVLTTGDNLYGNRYWFGLLTSSGSRDSDWEERFFRPYEEILRSIPFYPTLGNHDGDARESRDDLAAYLDNFFFPAPRPSRYYRFNFGGLADFFALDSTDIGTQHGGPIYAPGSGQARWLERELAASTAPWKVPYFHNPPFTAGPEHPPALGELQAFVDLFNRAGVRAVFNGHEHNFQWSEVDEATHGFRYVVTGAGGQLRAGDVRGRMQAAHIAAWAPAHHFLLVEIEDDVMSISVLGSTRVVLQDKDGRPVPQPLVVRRSSD